MKNSYHPVGRGGGGGCLNESCICVRFLKENGSTWPTRLLSKIQSPHQPQYKPRLSPCYGQVSATLPLSTNIRRFLDILPRSSRNGMFVEIQATGSSNFDPLCITLFPTGVTLTDR
jgi:hypothetical protein